MARSLARCPRQRAAEGGRAPCRVTLPGFVVPREYSPSLENWREKRRLTLFSYIGPARLAAWAARGTLHCNKVTLPFRRPEMGSRTAADAGAPAPHL